MLREIPLKTPATKHCRVQNSSDAFTEIYHTKEEPITANIAICRIQEYDAEYDDYITCDYGWLGQDLESKEFSAIYMFRNPFKPKGEPLLKGIKDNPFFMRGDDIYEIRKENGIPGIWIVNIVAKETEARLIAQSIGIVSACLGVPAHKRG